MSAPHLEVIRNDTPVVSLEHQEAAARSNRLKRLDGQLYEASKAVDVALYENGLLENPYISPGIPEARLVGVHGLRCREWLARVNLTSYLQRQAVKYQLLLRRAIASDAVAEADRAAILQGLYGLRGRKLDAKVFTETERTLIQHYRQLGIADRQMVRTLFERLANTTDSGSRRPDGDLGV